VTIVGSYALLRVDKLGCVSSFRYLVAIYGTYASVILTPPGTSWAQLPFLGANV